MGNRNGGGLDLNTVESRGIYLEGLRCKVQDLPGLY